MGQFQLFAQPAWVNLLVFIPLGLFIGWRGKGLEISGRQLLFATLFALAFGFVEAAVVVYLRAATGLLPGYEGNLSEVQRLGRGTALYPPVITQFPQSLLTVEVRVKGPPLLCSSVSPCWPLPERENGVPSSCGHLRCGISATMPGSGPQYVGLVHSPHPTCCF